MELYSNASDCFDLAMELRNEMKGEIKFYGSPYQEILSGQFFSNIEDYIVSNNGINFYIKYAKDGFLRITVANYNYNNASRGEKLAVLSILYEFLSNKFGSADFFYTIADDSEDALSLQWSFANKEEDKIKFRNNNYFDDADVDKLIVIGKDSTNGDTTFSHGMKKLIESKIGLPYELLGLVDENIDDFTKYKYGDSTSKGSKRNI